MRAKNVSAQIERIRQMEQLLDEVTEAVSGLPSSLTQCAQLQQKIEALASYFGSKEWFADFDADCAGELPPDLKRGVLSQDAVYNVLMEYDWLKNTQGKFPKEDGYGKGNEV